MDCIDRLCVHSGEILVRQNNLEGLSAILLFCLVYGTEFDNGLWSVFVV